MSGNSYYLIYGVPMENEDLFHLCEYYIKKESNVKTYYHGIKDKISLNEMIIDHGNYFADLFQALQADLKEIGYDIIHTSELNSPLGQEEKRSIIVIGFLIKDINHKHQEAEIPVLSKIEVPKRKMEEDFHKWLNKVLGMKNFNYIVGKYGLYMLAPQL